MTLSAKQQEILKLLKEDQIDLQKIYTEEYLKEAPGLLSHLLDEEKEEFTEKCAFEDEVVTFDVLYTYSILDFYFQLLQHRKSTMSDEMISKIIEDFEPHYVAFGNEIAYSKRYYLMLKLALDKDVDKEQQRLLEKAIEQYDIRGIGLSGEKQEQLKEINTELAALVQKFSENSLKDKAQYELHVTNEAAIKTMPAADKSRAEEKAKTKNMEGYIFDASYGSYVAVLKYCSDQSIREQMYQDCSSFASSDEFDNRGIIIKMLNLRNQKASIIGYTSYGAYSLKTKMASSPEEVIELLTELQGAAKEKAKEELSQIQASIEVKEETLGYADIAYYLRLYKEHHFNFDEELLKQYFEFEQTVEGMLGMATKLYGIVFTPVESSKLSYDTGVKVYAAEKDDKLVSYFVCDFFYRPEKRAGARANVLRTRFLDGEKSVIPVVINVSNFQKNENGVTLLSENEVRTMFHEFGHGLHEMLSQTPHEGLTGFGVERDFVELPSQFMENRAKETSALQLFARHYKTNEPIPTELCQIMKDKESFGKGMFVAKQGEYGLLDMMLYTQEVPSTIEELDEKITTYLNTLSIFPHSETYKMYTTFGHIFAGGYSAGYYSYIWAEIIEAQVFEVFKKTGIFDTETANRFLETILGAGCTKDAAEMFEDFVGESVNKDAYMKRHGLV